LAWNSRTISTGTAGRFEPERVDAFLRNGWTISSEYAGKQPQAETHIPHVTYARCIITAWSARQCNQRLWALCYRVLWLSQSSECACEFYCGSLGRGLGDESQAPNWMTHLWAGISQSGSWMGRLPPKLARQRVIALRRPSLPK